MNFNGISKHNLGGVFTHKISVSVQIKIRTQKSIEQTIMMEGLFT